MTVSSPEFRAYASHVLLWEGGKSNDRDDSSAKCVSSGQIHTNKGVTFCTFKLFASSLGISPVTHERFLALTDSDAHKFIFLFFKQSGASQLPAPISFLVAEAAWLSGMSKGVITLKQALNELGSKLALTGSVDSVLLREVARYPLSKVFESFNYRRLKFYENIVRWRPSNRKYLQGWLNRQASIRKKLLPFVSGKKGSSPVGTILVSILVFSLIFLK